MLSYLKNTRTLTLAVFATAILTGLVSVPAGAKDKAVSKSEIKNLISSAETKADHERIAQYFDSEATKYYAEAKEHSELAPVYQRNPDQTISKHPWSARSFQHCDSLSKSLQQAGDDAHQLAAEHREMGNAVHK